MPQWSAYFSWGLSMLVPRCGHPRAASGPLTSVSVDDAETLSPPTSEANVSSQGWVELRLRVGAREAAKQPSPASSVCGAFVLLFFLKPRP